MARLGDPTTGTLLAKTGVVTPEPDTGAVVVPAGGEFFAKANIHLGREECRVTTAFTPKPGGHYEVRYGYLPGGSKTAPTCSATVFEIDPGSLKAAPEQTANTKYGC